MNQFECHRLPHMPHMIEPMAKAVLDMRPRHGAEDTTLEDLRRFYRGVLAGEQGTSQTVIATDEQDKFAAMATITPEGMDNPPELKGWLFELYVLPKYRCLGLGTWLLAQAEAEALAMGYQTLHLFSEDSQPFFEGAGWDKLKDSHLKGRPGTVMVKDIAKQARLAVNQE